MDIPSDLKIVPLESIPKGQECESDLPKLCKLALLLEAICEKEKGVGLSAVQVGVPFNFFVVNYDYFSTRNRYRYFVDCVYTPITDDKEKSVEGCLSIRGVEGKLRYFEVSRFKKVSIKGKELIVEPTLQLKEFELTPTDYYRIVFQHEIDHQNLITIDQIGKEVHLWNKE